MSLIRLLPVALATTLLSGAAVAQLKLPKTAPGAAASPAAATAPAVAAPAVTATAANTDKEAAGQLAAHGWLTLLDRRDWGTAWEVSAGMFRSAVPLPAWMEGIPKVRAPLGPLADRKISEAVYKSSLQGRPDGDYVTVNFISKFGDKDVEEVVTTVREADGKWRVTGYSTR